jgi:flagellar assembly protein FliH
LLKGELVTDTKAKIVPLDYAPVGAEPAPPDWSSAMCEERSGRSEEQLAARARQFDAEKAALLHGRDLEIAAARAEGYETGRRQQQEEYAMGLAVAREALMRALDEFKASRDRYFAQVEGEVVDLSLAIAARILNREAQMDPLLLSGAVRVALGQLAESTDVQLRIPAPESELWNQLLHLLPNLPSRPAVVSDDSMAAGECRIETHLGSVDLGIKAQLEEIERGFFDLLEHRRKAAHAAIA